MAVRAHCRHRLGLRTALSVKYAQGDLVVVDSLDVADHKTRTLERILDAQRIGPALLVPGYARVCRLRCSCTQPGGLRQPAAGRAQPRLPLPGAAAAGLVAWARMADAHRVAAVQVYAMLHRPTLVLSLQAVDYFLQRLGSAEGQMLRARAVFGVLEDLCAICAAHPSAAADDPVLAPVRAALVRSAVGSPSVVIAAFLQAARQPADPAQPFAAVLELYGFPPDLATALRAADA